MIPAQMALKNNRGNKLGRWVGEGDTAQGRLSRKVVIPFPQQSFMATPSDTFFIVGSCFARNIEEWLIESGVRVLSTEFDLMDLGATTARKTGIFNKYTPQSILQEFQWASGEREFDERLILGVGSQFYDAQLRSNTGFGTLEQMLQRREQIREYFAQAFEADIIVITLGLTETWFDHEANAFLNATPDPKAMAANKERFSFHNLGAEECLSLLREMHGIIKRHGKEGQRVVITVSPVPLGRTFSGEDIIVANMTSKTTLRVAAKTFADETEGVDYFPSYEAVTLSDPELSWAKDRLHVSNYIVGRIITQFLERYGIIDAETTEEELQIAETEEGLLGQMRHELERQKNKVMRL